MTLDTHGSRDPRFVDLILNWRGTSFAARVALVGAYLVGGVVKLLDFPAAVKEQAHFGVPLPVVSAVMTIAVELIGPLLILSGRFVWLGAGMLGVFTGFAALTANAFWTMQGAARFTATNAFLEHIGLIGGFVLAAIAAEDARRARQDLGDKGVLS